VKWGTEPVLTAVGAVLGLTGGIWHLVRTMQPAPDEENKHQPPGGRSGP